MKLLAIFLVLSCGSNVVSPAERDAAITENELVRRTQELYDAVVPGNQVPWKKYFANDCIFADEKGRTMDKTKLVADITPMRAGYSGAIKIEQVQSRIYDNVAILSYEANETETIFDQNVSARYHVTDTWLRRDGIGRSSPARPIVIMKIRPSAKPIQRSSPTSLVPTS